LVLGTAVAEKKKDNTREIGTGDVAVAEEAPVKGWGVEAAVEDEVELTVSSLVKAS
jgi:hypothetical protein